MGFLLGKDAVIYYRLGGVTGGGGSWTLLDNVRDVKPVLDMSKSDVTTRGSGGFKENAATLIDAPISFEMIADPDDTGYSDFKTQFLERGIIGIRFLDQLEANGGTGFHGDMQIFKFEKAEPLDGAQMVSVEIGPTRGATHMEEYP